MGAWREQGQECVEDLLQVRVIWKVLHHGVEDDQVQRVGGYGQRRDLVGGLLEQVHASVCVANVGEVVLDVVEGGA